MINKLILLGTLTFVFSFANIASADQFTMRETCNDRCAPAADMNFGNVNSNYYPPQNFVNNTNYDYYNSNNGYQYSNNNANNYSAPSAPTVNYANSTVSSAPARTVAVATVKKATTTTTKTVAVNTNTNTTTNNSNLGASAASAVAPSYTVANNNGLTALTLFGNSGFLPDTVFEWMITIFLILVLILLIRQFRPVHAHDPHGAPVHH